MAIPYFAYGSNMDSLQMMERCPDSVFVGKATLKDYMINFTRYSGNWKGGVADIVESKESVVWGLLYEISDNDLNNLDVSEGHPTIYKRINVLVEDDKESFLSAYAYEVVNKKSFIQPSNKYLSILINAAVKYDFPGEYRKHLEQSWT